MYLVLTQEEFYLRDVLIRTVSTRNVVIGLGGKVNGVRREDGFIITVALEVMAILCLANDISDLKKRLGNILVAYTYDGNPVFCKDIKADGAIDCTIKGCSKA